MTTRREFLRTAVRAALLGGVAALGAAFWLRQRGCVNDGACGACGQFNRCSLPAAEAARKGAHHG